MNVIRISNRILEKVTFTVYLSSAEYADLIAALNCLVVPYPIEIHEDARQLLLSEVPENQQRRIKNLLTQMVTNL